MPIRPLTVGDVLSGAFTLIRRNPRATLGLAAIVETFYGICSAFLSWRELSAAHELTSLPPQPTSAQVSHALGHFFSSFAPLLGFTFLLAFLFQSLLTGMLTVALGRGLLGDKITIEEALRRARVLSVLGLSLLELLIVIAIWVPVTAIGVALAIAKIPVLAALVGVVGGIATLVAMIWIVVRLALAVPAVVLEELGPVAAMKRSWQLVRGSWWRIFGISLLAILVVFFVSAILQVPFAIVSSLAGGGAGFTSFHPGSAIAAPTALGLTIGAVGSIIATTCTRPISAAVSVLLYADMRIRREGLDLALQQAGQQQGLTGDEFMSLWRPGRQVPGQSPAGYPGTSGYPGMSGYPGTSGGGPGQGQGGAGRPPHS